MFFYGNDNNEPPDNVLKVRCWVCQKDVTPFQQYDFENAKYKITMRCCDRNETISLTLPEIHGNNASGIYQAFLL